MAISIFEAINNVRDDKNWAVKTFLVSVFMFASSILVNFTELEINGWIILIAVVLGLTAGIYVFGFLFKSVHNALNSDSFELANFNDANLLLVGLKGWLAFIGYYTIIYFIFAFIFIIFGIIFALLSMLIYGILVTILGLSQNVVIGVGIIAVILLTIIISLYFGMFVNTATVCYLKRLNFTDIFALDTHFAIIKENHKLCWTFVGKTILYSLLWLLVFLVLAISLVGWLMIPFAYAYAYLVYYNLQVQFAKTIQIEKYLAD